MNNDEKKCPFCAESIKREAIKCRYCHSDIADTVYVSKMLESVGDSFDESQIPLLTEKVMESKIIDSTSLICAKCSGTNQLTDKICRYCNYPLKISSSSDIREITKITYIFNVVAVVLGIIIVVYFLIFFNWNCVPWSSITILQRRFNCPSWTW